MGSCDVVAGSAEEARSFGRLFGAWPPIGTATVKAARLRPGVHVLDAWCGSGTSAIPAAEQAGPHGVIDAAGLAESSLERRRAEDEVRFFAHGTGCFSLHPDGRVHAVVCEAGDPLSVPAGTRHWFDMGPRPEFAVIRFFEKEDGWVGDFTGDPIARRFPRLDALLVPEAAT
ncbi:hypothetical protein GCM10010266_57640 [Streptomyces griseomycini]|uniref:cupin n=1 Tax=Streptomyces griseomycini TaxID=66895 RepID=UPI0019CE5638|nr:cupin [Streptomyces griseomycini]GGQ26876.1 hypothetical protein GCM10010266_57640 [Streptomyces griseomycini]